MLNHKINAAGLRTLADDAISFVGDVPTYNVYIVGGICVVTWKHPITGEIKSQHTNQLSLTHHVTSIIDEIDQHIYGCCPKQSLLFSCLLG